jgi:hypothetical protein
MSITKAFRATLALGLVSAPLALVGCDDAASTPATPPAAAGKPAEAPKAPDAAKPAPAPAPTEKK